MQLILTFKDIEAFDVVIKATINPKNWAESTANFHLSTEGMFRTSHSLSNQKNRYGYYSYSSNYEPGTYNISASFMIINVVKPSSR